MTYNGWTNRATWLVSLWFNPESKADVQAAREVLEEAIDNVPNFLRDFIQADVNWEELEQHFDNDDEQENE